MDEHRIASVLSRLLPESESVDGDDVRGGDGERGTEGKPRCAVMEEAERLLSLTDDDYAAYVDAISAERLMIQGRVTRSGRRIG